jgi:hypothetical protein
VWWLCVCSGAVLAESLSQVHKTVALYLTRSGVASVIITHSPTLSHNLLNPTLLLTLR